MVSYAIGQKTNDPKVRDYKCRSWDGLGNGEIMKKMVSGALVGCMLLMAGCGTSAVAGQSATQAATQQVTQATTKAAGSGWKDGIDLVGFDINDKNGQRRVWVSIGTMAMTVYNDDGNSWASFTHAEFADLDYSRKNMEFKDVDGDGYLDIVVPTQNTDFGKYNYIWTYDFVNKRFDNEYIELANEKEVLTGIANGILGESSSRQITQVFNDSQLGIVNGTVAIGDTKAKVYNVVEGTTTKARLYFSSEGNGSWYVDTDLDDILGVVVSNSGSFSLSGVAANSTAKAIAAYTVGDYRSSKSKVSQDIANLLTTAGEKNVTSTAVENAINAVVDAYENVRDEDGNKRTYSSTANVFDMVCEKLELDSKAYSGLK
jgi:hypothetical protein